jgi:hypothetical protein
MGLSGLSDRKLLLQTSSAGPSIRWAGLRRWGFISHSRTGMPRRASWTAHSLPASPAPMTVTGSMPALLTQMAAPLQPPAGGFPPPGPTYLGPPWTVPPSSTSCAAS